MRQTQLQRVNYVINKNEMSKKLVSILLPAYNEEGSFPLIERSMSQVIKDNSEYEWEILLVNDGSTDHTLEQMIRLHNNDNHFSYLNLSRNYGKEIAMLAGMDFVKGDALIIMDSDMQHPVDVIPEMLKHWEEGYDDVYAQRKNSHESLFKKATSRLYYRLLQKMTRIPIQRDAGDFRLLDRSCVEALRCMRETERNTKGLYSWIGFKKYGITYNQKEREVGKTKWSFIQLLNLAINGLASYTIAPLRLSTILGLMVSFVAFAYLGFILISTLLYGDPVAGYPTLMVTILFLGGVQLLSLGIIGEYLGKVFNETKGRPVYFVESYNGKKWKPTVSECDNISSSYNAVC